jgi:hypothetical protein
MPPRLTLSPVELSEGTPQSSQSLILCYVLAPKKRRRGRPAMGKDPLVSARLPQELVDSVEAWASANSASRSEAIRRLVELGLKAKGK